jgi:hypothetical protein
MILRREDWQRQLFEIDEAEDGLIVGSNYYGSDFDRAGVSWVDARPDQKRLRLLIATNQDELITTESFGSLACLVAFGWDRYAEAKRERDRAIEFIFDFGPGRPVGTIYLPAYVVQGTVDVDDAILSNAPCVLEVYGNIRVNPFGRGKARERRAVRKVWQVPAESLLVLEGVPYAETLPNYPFIELAPYFPSAGVSAAGTARASRSEKSGGR